MVQVYISDDDLRSLEFVKLTLSNMLRLHSNLNEDETELLETHIGRLRKMIDKAKEADDI